MHLYSVSMALRNNTQHKGVYFSLIGPKEFNYDKVILETKVLAKQRKLVGDKLKLAASSKVKKAVYVYDSSRNLLIHIFDSRTNALRTLNANNSAVYSSMKNNANYKNIYLTFDPIKEASVKLLSVQEMNSYVSGLVRVK